MHPAYSVIFFTTASGAGYGLLIWLVLRDVLGSAAINTQTSGLGLVFALMLISAGLLSSMGHLGRPERAWRAFSQWRTSWLSREGVLAMATFVPAGLLAAGWLLVGEPGRIWSLLGLLAAGLALATVWATGMIYQSLTPIRAWSQPSVAPIYVLLALATGGVLTLLVLRLTGEEPAGLDWITAAMLLLALALKRHYWASIDGRERSLTPGDATGLGRFGAVRVLEPPHTQANFVMREMGYTIARKHALKLRALVLWPGLALALFCIMLSLALSPLAATLLTGVATVAVALGVVVERWLFFAEAQHVVSLYYGADKA